MSYLQSAYIVIAKPFATINTKKNRTIRNILVFICFVSIFSIIMLYYTKLGMLGEWTVPLRELDRFHRALIECILLGIIVLLSIEEDIKKVEWNWFIPFLWYASGFFILISGLFHNIGDGAVISQIAVLFLFPFLFLAWQSRDDAERLYFLVSLAIALIIFMVCILSMFKFSWMPSTISGSRYQGVFRNPNALGIVMVAGSVASVYLCSCKKIVYVLLSAFDMGALLQFAWLSKSRSALLAIIVILMVGLLLYVKNRCSIKSLLLFIVIMALVCAIYGITIKRTDYNNEANTLTLIPISEVKAVDDSDNAVDNLNRDEAIDVTSGRIAIWKKFINMLNSTGHDIVYYLPVRLDYEGMAYSKYYNNAHNTIIDVGFRSGIPAAILLGLMELLALIYVLVRLVWKRKALRRADIFACSAIMAFFIVGLVEAIQDPLSEILAFLFFLSCGRLFTFGCEIQVNEVEAE